MTLGRQDSVSSEDLVGHDWCSQDKCRNRLRITGSCRTGLVKMKGGYETGLHLALQDSQYPVKWISLGHPREQLLRHRACGRQENGSKDLRSQSHYLGKVGHR